MSSSLELSSPPSTPLVKVESSLHEHTLSNPTICQHCTDTLLYAFDHCLSKTTTLLPSLAEIDEVKAATRISLPPEVWKVKDPTGGGNAAQILCKAT